MKKYLALAVMGLLVVILLITNVVTQNQTNEIQAQINAVLVSWSETISMLEETTNSLKETNASLTRCNDLVKTYILSSQ